MSPAREEILGRVRTALHRSPDAPVPAVPPAARVRPRAAGPAGAETEVLLAEIERLAGKTRRLASRDDLQAALAELVTAEEVRKATVWATPDLLAWEVPATLRARGVELVSPQADKRLVAQCDLGITGVDLALPETGTLVLRSSPERPRVVSLLPRVHLAILRPAALRADLHQVFSEVKADGSFVLITGPSRTSDIELTLTIGVHGPKSLHVWVVEA